MEIRLQISRNESKGTLLTIKRFQFVWLLITEYFGQNHKFIAKPEIVLFFIFRPLSKSPFCVLVVISNCA